MPQIPAKVNTNKLAFWESLIDVGDKPSRYLKYGEKVIISDPTPIYANKMGDKAYCKVQYSFFPRLHYLAYT